MALRLDSLVYWAAVFEKITLEVRALEPDIDVKPLFRPDSFRVRAPG